MSSILRPYWKEEISNFLDYDKWYQNNLWFRGINVSIENVPRLRKFIEDRIKDAIKFERRRVKKLRKRVPRNNSNKKDIFTRKEN